MSSAPMDPDDPYPSLVALAAAFRTGALRPSRVMRAHLNRIERLEPLIGAFQALYAEDAMMAAEGADKALAAGHGIGPFHGIPFALKDLCDLEGRVTTGGSKAMAGRISSETATIARRLIEAGGIVIGKTKTVECALGGWGTNQHMGTPWNPYDMACHRVPGGSSSGTAAALASGFAVCGVGTDTGGSVRMPAAFCGLVGLKVTAGRLPLDGILPLSQTLDTPGPLARSLSDALIMYLLMAGAESWAIARDHAAGAGIFVGHARGVEGLRLGILDENERAACSGDVLIAYDAAIARLAEAGANLIPFQPPRPYDELKETCGQLIAAEGYAHHRKLYDDPSQPMDEDVRSRMLGGRDVSAADYLALQADRVASTAAFVGAMADFDALLTPTTTTTAPLLAHVDQKVSPAHFTRPVNYLGLCALSLPSGLAGDGLPTSLQIVARANDEPMAVRVGSTFEALQPSIPHPDLH